jgi:hypothetical protein
VLTQFRAIIRRQDTSACATLSDYASSSPRIESPSEEYPTVILSASGHTAENVAEWVERTGDVAVFGRYFSESDELKVRVWRMKAKVTEIQL